MAEKNAFQKDLDADLRQRLKMEFATTETLVNEAEVGEGALPMAQELLGSITRKAITKAHLPLVFSELYPLVRRYMGDRCFGKTVDLESEKVRRLLRGPEWLEAVAQYLAHAIGRLTVERREIAFENQGFKLADIKHFTWRRNLPPPHPSDILVAVAQNRPEPGSPASRGLQNKRGWIRELRTPRGRYCVSGFTNFQKTREAEFTSSGAHLTAGGEQWRERSD